MTAEMRLSNEMAALRGRLERAGLLQGGPATAALRAGENRYVTASFGACADGGPELEKPDADGAGSGAAGRAEEALETRPLSGGSDPFAAVFLSKPGANAALLLAPPYAAKVSETMRVLWASLDDMAQIVGVSARVAGSLERNELRYALKRRNACFVRGRGMLVTGRSVNEAVTAAILLEKAARTQILAKKLGGAKRLPLFSALLMHAVYQKKYSVINLSEEAKREEAE